MKNRTIVYIGNRLQKKGLNPTSVDMLGDKFCASFNVIRASHLGNPIFRLIHMWITILFNAHKTSYLIIDTYSTNAFIYAWTSGILAKLLGLNYIPYLHGGDLPKRYIKDKNKCQKYFEDASKIVSPSGYLKAETESIFNVHVQVIPNYLELEDYTFTKRSSFSKVQLLWVRAFHKIYNPSLAPEIVFELKKKGYQVTLTMVGPDKDGSLSVVKQKATDLDVLDSIYFTGRLSKKEWISKSCDFSFFINTTNADNTPVSVMEAMALGFPVITTNVGGIPYLFINGVEGIQVPANDANAMADAIITLLKDPIKTKEISVSARRKSEEWDWDNVNKNWTNLLNS